MNIALAPRPSVALDPITVEVIGASLSSIVEETGEALIRASYSTNIKERRDCSTALFNVQGQTLCQAEHIPIHLGSFIGIVPQILKQHAVESMRPGDVFVGNDAYEGGGTHLPDIVLAEPIFVDGRIVAWTVNLAHHSDFADRGHAHIYQEGLRIPTIRLYKAGELQKDVLDLILLNCQVPRERLSDLRAQMAANRVGVQRFQALCAKSGTDVVLAAGEALLATTYYMVKSVVDPTILPNAGLARPLTITAAEGTILNCRHPAAVNGRVQTCQRVSDLILGALSHAVPTRVSACTNSSCCVATFSGEMPKDGTIWVYVETMGGGAGARPTKDGLDGVHVHTTNTSNLPVEALELEYPLTLMRYEMVDGSGGAGKFRGGMGLRRVYRAEADCRVRVDVSRLRSQSWGLYGGLPGAHGQMVPGPGVKFVRDAAELKAGDWFEVITPGAGGYGPPAERERAAVARDLAEGVIDAKTARDIYGFNP